MPVFDSMDHQTPQEDLDALAKLANEASKIDSDGCVEIGSWAGATALVLHRYFGNVYCVDTWQGNPNDRLGDVAKTVGEEEVFRTFCRNMGEKLFHDVIPCRGPSLSWASIWPFKMSLVFIDANHDYEHVRADILAWRNHVVPHGIICGHDYGVFEGVTRAVDELVPKDELQLDGRYIWWTKAR